jgi:predicted Zn-dependent peptidase
VAGDVETFEIKELAEKWFGPISSGPEIIRNLPIEPRQTEARSLSVHRDVPFDSIYKSYHMCSRYDKRYYTTDLISDILSNGDSSRLFNRLVKEKNIFSELNAYISGDLDEGTFLINGKLVDGISMEEADKTLTDEVELLMKEPVNIDDLNKVKNKIESTLEFSEMNVLNKAMNLAYSELIGDANLINLEIERYSEVTADNIQSVAKDIFRKENCSTLYYHTK